MTDSTIEEVLPDIWKGNVSYEEAIKALTSLIQREVLKGRIAELQSISICNHFGDYADHIVFKDKPESFTKDDRIKALKEEVSE